MAAAAAACDVRKGAWGYSQAPFVLGEWFGSYGCRVCERCGVRCGRFAGIRRAAAIPSKLCPNRLHCGRSWQTLPHCGRSQQTGGAACWDPLHCSRSQQALLGFAALQPFPATLSQQTLRSPTASFANPVNTNVLPQAMRNRCRMQSNEIHTANLYMCTAFRTEWRRM